jgi:hypothetical protein
MAQRGCFEEIESQHQLKSRRIIILPYDPISPEQRPAQSVQARTPGEIMSSTDEKLNTHEAARHLGLAQATLAKMRCWGGSFASAARSFTAAMIWMLG